MKRLIILVLCSSMASDVLAQQGEFHLDKEYKIDKNGTIDLASSDGKVFITGSTRTAVHVKIDRKVSAKGFQWGGEDFKVEVEENNGDLRIRERQSGGNVSVGYYHEEYRIEIQAPEGVNLTVRGDDGDYYIKNINGAIEMTLDDADAELSGCKGNSFSFRLDDGDLRLDAGKGKLEIDADDADVEIYNAAFSSIDANFDDGDLIIETSLVDEGEYYFESQDGLVSLNVTGGGGQFDIHHDDGHVAASSDYKILSERDDRTTVSLPKGSAKVKVRADDARVKLTTR